jgi:hypothetical protein
MPLSVSSLQLFMALFDTVEAAFDFVPSSPPPSPIARVRGSLRNAKASLKALEARLEGKEPNEKDLADLMRLRTSLIEMTQDKWVLDSVATIDLPWEGADQAAAVGVTVPAVPLRFEGAMGMIAEGLLALAAKA